MTDKTVEPRTEGERAAYLAGIGYVAQCGLDAAREQARTLIVADDMIRRRDGQPRYALHHIDGDPCNNDPANLAYVKIDESS